MNKGADVKMLQYDTQVDEKDKCIDKINLFELIQRLFTSKISAPLNNCILINIEKDIGRYHSSVEELNKLSINNFVHLKATYWKNRSALETDLTFILKFLQQFNPEIEAYDRKINMFSECNDRYINIQDGPLACYCSHLRAMIYGYTNFDKYTIIAEDDISIVNTELISSFLDDVPDDWDIICFNCIPQKGLGPDTLYKFTDGFHSTHLYMIRNSCMPTLFKNMYPMVDQVDVLISNTRNILNIYNLPKTVYQKSVSTNTQNNLHIINTSPNYINLKLRLETTKDLLMFFANIILPDNKHNTIIVINLMFDVIYGSISDICDTHEPKSNALVDPKYSDYDEYLELLHCICYVVQCTKKGINVREISLHLTNILSNTLLNFKLHNKVDDATGEIIKAYNFGSTSHTYILENNDICIKQYNDVLRWKTVDHNDSDSIFKKELEALKLQNNIKLLFYDEKEKILKMSYEGKSLYNEFLLPLDWKDQLKELFNNLTKKNIYYPEFRLQNILNKNGKLSFVDFGLSKIYEGANNDTNYDVFIELLEILNGRFEGVDIMERYILYDTFINGIKLHKVTKYLNNVF